MNLTTTSIILTTIGVKNSFEIVNTSLNLLKSTAKTIVGVSPKHRDITKFFVDTDIAFKITVIQEYLDCLEAGQHHTLILGVQTIVNEIRNEIKQLHLDMQVNTKKWFAKKNTDKSIVLIEQLINTLDLRFKLLTDII